VQYLAAIMQIQHKIEIYIELSATLTKLQADWGLPSSANGDTRRIQTSKMKRTSKTGSAILACYVASLATLAALFMETNISSPWYTFDKQGRGLAAHGRLQLFFPWL
jgi:hypothetical protein